MNSTPVHLSASSGNLVLRGGCVCVAGKEGQIGVKRGKPKETHTPAIRAVARVIFLAQI